MSEPAAKQRQMIDLDEFERRLSRPPAPARNDDPLAELARLVGGVEDRFETMFNARPGRTAVPAEPTPSALPPEPHVPDGLIDESHEHAQPAPPRRADFSAIEAGLRGSLAPEFHDFSHFEETQHQDFADDDRWLDTPVPQPQTFVGHEMRRSRMPLYATAAIILAGMAGIGATFALKRTPASPQQIALISASTTPVKFAAPSDADTNASGGASVLDKTPQPAPTAVVSHSEQPVDVNAVAQPAPASAAPATTQLASTAPADTVPVPPPPGADSGQGSDLADMMEPHKVKTVAVRPDGSLADSGAPASAAPPSPVGSIVPSTMTADYNGAGVASPAAPAAVSPAPNPNSSRPRTASNNDDLPWSSGPSQAAAPTPAAEAPAPRQRPERIARVETGDADVAADTPAHAAGGFSVQLAAPATQAEARSALNRLTRSYGAELRGYHLKFHQAKVADKTVFRVRVGGLSHDSAISLCEKLKGKGGACFVARD